MPPEGTNPFDEFLTESRGDPNRIQLEYELHRSNRNRLFKAKLNDDFRGWQVDEILRKLHAQASTNGTHADGEIPFVDHRHNLNFYARPPQHIKALVAEVQREIQDVAPSIWFTPQECLHATTLEVASSRTEEDVEALASHLLQSGTASEIAHYTCHYRARLVKPVVNYDTAAMAVSFVPAAGENTYSPEATDDAYTYHHLRRDLGARVMASGIQLAARYVVPSAHLTIARFVTQEGFVLQRDGAAGLDFDKERVAAFTEKIDKVNSMLQEKYWPQADGTMPQKGEWVVGEGQGLEFSKGTSWYGGGKKVLVGQGF